MIKVKVNGAIYEADVNGLMTDRTWDNRESKSILLEMRHEDALSVFSDGVTWSILMDIETPVIDENGELTGEVTVTTEEYDNSEFCIAGDVTDHRNGFVTVKMGKLTDLEEAYEILLGGAE